MEGRGHSDVTSLHSQGLTSIYEQRAAKRQRSNPGLDTSFEDLFGGGLSRYSSGLSPVSDPELDYNLQTKKRLLSEVMANNLTRTMNLGSTASAGGSLTLGPVTGDPVFTPPSQIHPTPFIHNVQYPHSYNPATATPPGGCSPQRTVASEMSEGPDPGDILQPMLISDVSLSQGKASGITAESTSETADSDFLELRERSVSLSCQSWGAAPAAAISGGGLCPNAAGSSAGTHVGLGGAQRSSGGSGGGGGGGIPGLYAPAPPFPPPGLANISASTAAASPFAPFPARRASDATGGSSGLGVLPPAASKTRGAPRVEIPTSPSDTRFVGLLDLRKTALLNNANAKSRQSERASSEALASVALAVAGATAPMAGTSAAGGGASSSVSDMAPAVARCLQASEQIPLPPRGSGVAAGAAGSAVQAAGSSAGGVYFHCGWPSLSPSQLNHHQHHHIQPHLPPKYPHHPHHHAQQQQQQQQPISQHQTQPQARASAAASRSNSAISDAMSEGGGGGSFVAMEMSSNSADGAGMGGGGSLDDGLEEPQEGSGEARLAGMAQGVALLTGLGVGPPERSRASRARLLTLVPLAMAPVATQRSAAEGPAAAQPLLQNHQQQHK